MSRSFYRVRFHEMALADNEIARVHPMEREVGNFFLTECNYPPNFLVPRHSHENPSFYLVLAGSIGERSRSRVRDCMPSTLLFTPPGEPHSNYTQRAGGRCFMIDINRHWLKSIREPSLNLDQWVDFDEGLPVSLARRAYKEARDLDALSPMVIEGLTLELLAEVSRRKTRLDRKSPQWLEQAREMLRARFAETVAISEIANAVGRHPVHLAAQFRRNYRCTIGDYVRQLRVEFACHQISASNTSLVEIALAAGFSDQGHFCRVFKSLVGLTPSQYRATLGRLKPVQNPLSDPSNPYQDVV